MNTVILHSCVDASLLQRTYEASWKSSEWTFEFPRNSSYDKRHPKITLIEHGQVISKDENLISLIKEIHSQIYDSYECFDREILFAGISMKDITKIIFFLYKKQFKGIINKLYAYSIITFK